MSESKELIEIKVLIINTINKMLDGKIVNQCIKDNENYSYSYSDKHLYIEINSKYKPSYSPYRSIRIYFNKFEDNNMNNIEISDNIGDYFNEIGINLKDNSWTRIFKINDKKFKNNIKKFLDNKLIFI